ncbi:hypothetical protein MTP99_005208 [Tenebrio molitor]|nr:hypothetical protein MTP99_005208 [Tenebrio molitor]
MFNKGVSLLLVSCSLPAVWSGRLICMFYEDPDDGRIVKNYNGPSLVSFECNSVFQKCCGTSCCTVAPQIGLPWYMWTIIGVVLVMIFAVCFVVLVLWRISRRRKRRRRNGLRQIHIFLAETSPHTSTSSDFDEEAPPDYHTAVNLPSPDPVPTYEEATAEK